MCAGLEVGPGARVFRRSETSSWAPIAFILSNMRRPSFEIPLDPQQGWLVGGDPNEPGAVLAHGGDLSGFMDSFPGRRDRGQRACRRWAGTSGQHLHPPLGGYDHPAAEDRISAKLRHDRLTGGARAGPSA